jgi:hypothetical protein
MIAEQISDETDTNFGQEVKVEEEISDSEDMVISNTQEMTSPAPSEPLTESRISVKEEEKDEFSDEGDIIMGLLNVRIMRNWLLDCI